jgi:amino acid adenylation domain-containing protein
VTAVEERTRVPVPHVQQRLWLADQVTPDSSAYLASALLHICGELDVAALERALTEIVARHEILRTSIRAENGDIVGVVRPVGDFVLDVRAVDPVGLDDALRAEVTEPIDIAGGILMRARLFWLAADDHVLCLTGHHLAFDGGSVQVLYRELEHFYRSESPLAPVPQFRDLALVGDALQDAGEVESMMAERRAALADLTPFELPGDFARPMVRTGEGQLCQAFNLPEDTVEHLVEIGRSKAASLYMVLLAGCQTVLYRYTGRTDVTTGVSSSLRRGGESANVIGPFFNMSVLPGNVSGNPMFTELVDSVRDIALDAYESRLIPFDALVTELGVKRDPSRTPLFQILVDFTVAPELPELHGLRVERIRTPGAGAKYDLTIEFLRAADGVDVLVEWDTALYRTETVMRLLEHLRMVLIAVADDPMLRVDDLPMLGPREIQELRELAESALEAPDTAGFTEDCLHTLFAAQVERTPDASAVRDGDVELSYAELYMRSTAIARSLIAFGICADMPVGVLLNRSVDLVAAVLGVLQAGGAYLPLDPEASAAWTQSLVAAAGAPVCIVPGADYDVGCRALTVDEMIQAGASDPELPTVDPRQLCAVYFTSGSTGKPKAVASTHLGWVGQMRNMQSRYRLAPGETVLLKTPLSFDDVAREIFWPLALGARIAVLSAGLHRDPRALIDAAGEHGIVWLQFVPDMLALFLDEIRPQHLSSLESLRNVVSDGDRLCPELVRLFREKLGAPLGCRLNNHWGTTEVSIDTTHHVCGPADAEGGDAVALGRPMEQQSVYVLDHVFQPAPYGATGELCIGGIGLARGYLGDPGRTARAFVPHPLRPGERVYRTGDMGRLRPDGTLEYRGRRDLQAKVRGVRVEFGEIEAAVREFPGVTDAAVALQEPEPGNRRLVAYAVLGDQGSDVTQAGAVQPAAAREIAQRATLRAFLADRLAPSAIPSVVVLLPALPRLPSGKLDRRALPSPDPGALAVAAYTPPATDAEQAVAEIWAGVLDVPRMSADADFFAAGGHSLLVTRAVNRMREAFGVDVPVRLVFEHATVRAAAARVEEMVLAAIEAMDDAEAEALTIARET